MDAHRKAIIHDSGQSRWRTPPALVAKLAQTFPMDTDLAADEDSAVLGRWLGPGSRMGEDALAVRWSELPGNGWGFVNPPYSLSEIRELKKHLHAAEAGGHEYQLLLRQIASLRIDAWAKKAYTESLAGFHTIGVFPYAPQARWFRRYVMGHTAGVGLRDAREIGLGWSGHAALDYWRISHRVSYLQPDGSPSNNAGVNTAIIHWGPNPGWTGPWVPTGNYWSYRE